MQKIDLPGMVIEKVDLGCGSGKKGGAIGIDKDDYGQEIIWDLTTGIPLPDNSVKSIYSHHFLEHITDHQSHELFKEIYRVCQDGAIVEMWTPYAGTVSAYYWGHLSEWKEEKVKAIIFTSSHWQKKECFVLEKLEKEPLMRKVDLTGYPENEDASGLYFRLRVKK